MDSTLDRRISPDQREVIHRHLQNIPVKVGALARELGLVVKVGTLDYGKSGQIAPDSEAPCGFAIRVNRHESKERQRFTLAHEIAHFLLHRDKIKNGIYENTLYRADGISNREEIEANRLAADILMPREGLANRLRGINTAADDELAEQLASEFQVSKPAMEIRLGVR